MADFQFGNMGPDFIVGEERNCTFPPLHSHEYACLYEHGKKTGIRCQILESSPWKEQVCSSLGNPSMPLTFPLSWAKCFHMLWEKWPLSGCTKGHILKYVSIYIYWHLCFNGKWKILLCNTLNSSQEKASRKSSLPWQPDLLRQTRFPGELQLPQNLRTLIPTNCFLLGLLNCSLFTFQASPTRSLYWLQQALAIGLFQDDCSSLTCHLWCLH